MHLPGRVPLSPCLGTVRAGCIGGALGSAEAVLGGIERALGLLHRGQGIGKRILDCGKRAAESAALDKATVGVTRSAMRSSRATPLRRPNPGSGVC